MFTVNWKGEIVLKMDPFAQLTADEDPDVESFDLFELQAKQNVGGTVVTPMKRAVWERTEKLVSKRLGC